MLLSPMCAETTPRWLQVSGEGVSGKTGLRRTVCWSWRAEELLDPALRQIKSKRRRASEVRLIGALSGSRRCLAVAVP